MAMEREELESLVRQIVSEVLAQSAPAPSPAPTPVQPGHQMEVRVHPDGSIVIRPSAAGQTEAAGVASMALWDCDCIATTVACTTCCPTCTCIEPPSACCCGACIEPPQQLLSASFESHTEEVFSRILEAEPMSRDQLVGHLWERVMKKLVHDEAVTFHAEQRGEPALPEPRGEAPGDAEPTP